MASFPVKGIIIREIPYGEADKMLKILTREHGMMTVSAKNARRPGRRMLLATSAMTFGEYQVSGSESTRFYLSDASVIESFAQVQNDVVLLTYCAHMADLILDTVREAMSADEIFTLVLHTLSRLTKPGTDHSLTIHVFELKLLFILGYTPVLNECVSCGKPLASGTGVRAAFSHSCCGILCGDRRCLAAGGEYASVSPATLDCMRYIASSPVEKIFSFRLDTEYAAELAALSSRYVCERLERNYTKLRMLNDFSV